MIPHKCNAAWREKKRKEITGEKKVGGGWDGLTSLDYHNVLVDKINVFFVLSNYCNCCWRKTLSPRSLAFAQSVTTLPPVVLVNPHFTFYNEDIQITVPVNP